jgi:hypothetical protein
MLLDVDRRRVGYDHGRRVASIDSAATCDALVTAIGCP